LLVLTCFFSLNAKVIKNPVCDFRCSLYENITAIELTQKETRLHVLCTGPVGHKVNFVSKLYIQDPVSGKKWYPTGIKGAVFDTEVAMPADGDSTFVLIFPPLDDAIRKIDYVNTDDDKLYGLSLENGRESLEVKNTVPPEVTSWIDQELDKAKNKTLSSDENFFCRDSARIVGYIKGYDVRSGFTTGELYIENAISRENITFVLEIEPDGRFHTTIPLIHPIKSGIILNGLCMNFYLEPGQTLAMVVDWEDMLSTYRQEISPYFKTIEYKGPTAIISSELNKYELKKTDYEQMKSKSVNAYKTEELSVMNENLSNLSKLEQTGTFLPKTIDLLKNKAIISCAMELMQYGDQKSTNSTTGQRIKNALPFDYYDFLKDLPLDNAQLMAHGEYDSFVNKFEFMPEFDDLGIESGLTFKGFINYLEDDVKIKISPQEKNALNFKTTDFTANTKDLEKINDANWETFIKKYKKEYDDYIFKYETLFDRSLTDNFLSKWIVKDTIMSKRLKMKSNLTYEIIKIRSISSLFLSRSSIRMSNTSFYLDSLSKKITHPFLIDEAKRYINDYYKKFDKGTYPLTEGKAAEILKKIIDPFKGKLLLLDFWSIHCGPCVQAIKDMKNARAKNLSIEGFAFIFIADETDSPIKKYEQFVKDQKMVNSYRISNADFAYIQQFFRFNGTPHYMLIDPKGNIMDDDFNVFKSSAEIKKLFKES